jgi:hypothetical protein
MDGTTREFLNTIYIAFATASGAGVLDEANVIISEAVDEGCIRDPEACEALRHLVGACPPDTIEQANDAAANLAESVGDLSTAVGDTSMSNLSAHIARRVASINASTPIDEIAAIVDMVDALEAAARRVKVAA